MGSWRWQAAIMLLVWGVGCTEYGFVGEQPVQTGDDDDDDDEAPPVVDTGTPPEPGSCDGWELSEPYAVAIDESCLAEPKVGTFNPVIEWQWLTNDLNTQGLEHSHHADRIAPL